MQDQPTNQQDVIKQRLLAIFHGIPPGEDRHETFLTMLHGPGWKERALAPDAPLMLVNALRILDIDKRLRRIETHLGLGSLPE